MTKTRTPSFEVSLDLPDDMRGRGIVAADVANKNNASI